MASGLRQLGPRAANVSSYIRSVGSGPCRTRHNLHHSTQMPAEPTSLPASITKLTGLKKLDLSGCTITDVPPSLYQLSGLRDLRLKGVEEMSFIPGRCLAKLQALETLELRCLGALPAVALSNGVFGAAWPSTSKGATCRAGPRHKLRIDLLLGQLPLTSARRAASRPRRLPPQCDAGLCTPTPIAPNDHDHAGAPGSVSCRSCQRAGSSLL